MLRRLPVSLRFDDEDTDFYYGFIEPKKNDRELSSLILDLLHVYHENPLVQDIVNDYVTSKSPYLHIQKELERIALEHSRNSVSANILGDFNDNARKKVSEPPEPVRKEEPKKEEDQLLLIQEMVQKTVTETLGKMLLGNVNLDTIGKTVAENVESQMKVSEPIVETSRVEIPVVEAPKREIPNVVVEPSIEKVVPPVKESQTQVKKPASFNKLMGSMKNS